MLVYITLLTQNFEVVPRFLENVSTPAFICDIIASSCGNFVFVVWVYNINSHFMQQYVNIAVSVALLNIQQSACSKL